MLRRHFWRLKDYDEVKSYHNCDIINNLHDVINLDRWHFLKDYINTSTFAWHLVTLSRLPFLPLWVSQVFFSFKKGFKIDLLCFEQKCKKLRGLKPSSDVQNSYYKMFSFRSRLSWPSCLVTTVVSNTRPANIRKNELTTISE